MKARRTWEEARKWEEGRWPPGKSAGRGLVPREGGWRIHEDVVRSDAEDEENHHQLEEVDVVLAEDDLPDGEGEGDGHENVEHRRARQYKGSDVEHDVCKWEGRSKEGGAREMRREMSRHSVALKSREFSREGTRLRQRTHVRRDESSWCLSLVLGTRRLSCTARSRGPASLFEQAATRECTSKRVRMQTHRGG